MPRKEKVCLCDAYAFPHRLGGGKCNEDLRCMHGFYVPEHPDYDPDIDFCQDCSYGEWADAEYDRWRDS